MSDYVRQLTNPRHEFERTEAARLCNDLRNDTEFGHVAEGRVIYWKSSGNVPPSDCIALAAHIGLPVDITACDAARDRQTTAAIQAYKIARAQRTPEQIAEEEFEIRAAFGPGETVVNIFTGETTHT